MGFKIGETNFLPTVLDLSTKEMVDGTLTYAKLDDATLVYDYAFYNQKNLSDVYAPKAESIGYRSFYGCSKLSTAQIYGCKTIGESAFEGCTHLGQIHIGKDLTSIGNDAFKNCQIWNVHYDGNMDDWAKITFSNKYSNPLIRDDGRIVDFYIKDELGNYVKPTDIVIPASVKSISIYTYDGLSSIESLTILGDTKNTTIPAGAFKSLINLRSLTITGDSSSGFNLLADYFNEDTSKYTYETQCRYIPESLKYFTYNGSDIKDRFCYGAYMLTNITFNGTGINISTFEGCSNLLELTLSSKLLSIKSDAFKNCTLLESVKYKGGLYYKTSGERGWCGILFGNIYSNPLSANDNVSLYLYNEASDTWNKEIEYYDSYNNYGNIKLPAYVFHNCKNITKVDFSAGNVVSLGEHAFDGCTNLTTIGFGPAIEEIPAYAFARTGINKLTLPTTINGTRERVNIKEYAFANCKSISELVIPDYYSPDYYLNNGKYSISNYAFSGSTPNKLTSPDLNFRNLFNSSYDFIKEIYIRFTDSNVLNKNKFSGMRNLNKLSIPNYAKIELESFSGCSALTELTYRGTMSEFNTAVTVSYWNMGSVIRVVHCTDGDISVTPV